MLPIVRHLARVTDPVVRRPGATFSALRYRKRRERDVEGSVEWPRVLDDMAQGAAAMKGREDQHCGLVGVYIVVPLLRGRATGAGCRAGLL